MPQSIAKILNGKLVRDEIALKLQKKVSSMKIQPAISIIQVGELPASSVFIRQKKLFGEKIGVKVEHHLFPSTISEKELLAEIEQLNIDPTIQGIIVQLPLPAHINKNVIIESIDPYKDVDGLHSINVKKLWTEDSTGITPATAKGIMTLCKYYGIHVEGKKVTVVGRSALVGQPIAQCFLNAGATVTICHKQTKKLHEHTSMADIVVVATGVPRLIKEKHVRKGQIVIDVGITSIEKKIKNQIVKKIVGDVDFEKVSKIVKAITPVPGGVGPMTVLSLFENVIEAAEKSSHRV